jgi:hemerythrin-like domain-containing protein
MAKRHPGLVRIARDHHDGLLLAVRLQQGERALLRLWSHDPSWQARFVIDFHANHLSRHFAAEEEKVFPLAEENIPDALPVVRELREHHAGFRSTISGMKDRIPEVTREELIALGKDLEAHIRLEDRTLFPLMEKHLEPRLLEQLEKDVEDYYPQDTT